MNRRPNDKILDNKFNKMEIDFVEIKEFKLDNQLKEIFIDDTSFEKFISEKIEMIIFDEWEKRGKFEINKKRNKVSNEDYDKLVFFFYDIHKKIDYLFFDESEFFFTFIIFFDLDPLYFYEKLFPSFKYKLLKRLEFFSKNYKKENKLF